MKVEIGQEVVVLRSGTYISVPAFGYFVTKVTSTGRFTVQRKDSEYQIKFNADGNEMGTDKYSRHWIETDVQKWRDIIAKGDRTMNAANAIKTVQPERISLLWPKDHFMKVIAEMKQKLAIAEDLVNKI